MGSWGQPTLISQNQVNSPDINYKAKFLSLESSSRSQRNVGGNNKVFTTKATDYLGSYGILTKI
jgi:hypothetical protein